MAIITAVAPYFTADGRRAARKRAGNRPLAHAVLQAKMDGRALFKA